MTWYVSSGDVYTCQHAYLYVYIFQCHHITIIYSLYCTVIIFSIVAPSIRQAGRVLVDLTGGVLRGRMLWRGSEACQGVAGRGVFTVQHTHQKLSQGQ